MLIFSMEETVSSERTGGPVVGTILTQTRPSEDSKDTNVETAHERTRRLVVETNTENVPDGCETRSCYERERFKVGDETFRERSGGPLWTMTIWVMSKQCWMRWTWTSEFILLWSMREYQRSRIDSDIWELSWPTRCSIRSTTKPNLEPVYSRIKNDSGSGQRRNVWIVRDGAPKRSV